MIDIELVYPYKDICHRYTLSLPEGSTVRSAIQASGILQDCPHLSIERCLTGIYGKKIGLSAVLKSGDRVELYRPILIDHKRKRQLLVEKRKKETRKGKRYAG